MNKPPVDSRSQVGQSSRDTGERLVYVMPEEILKGSWDNQVSLRELLGIIWRGKWLIVAMTAAFAALSVAYALLATEWYRAEVLLVPAEERTTPSLAGQLGELAALAGVSVGGGDATEAIATLRAREFARGFIEDYALVQVFFANEWDGAASRWRGQDPAEWPDVRDAVRYFHDKVLRVSVDRQSGLVTLAIEWTDPEVAAEWAAALVHRLNTKLRDRALSEAQVNVAYLQEELAQTTVVTLQQSISRLLESEMQKLMLARGSDEFAFRIIDQTGPPKFRERPKRRIIAVFGTMLGGVLGVIAVFFAHALRSDELSMTSEVQS
jgi:uncharacterized protein involved in exopolysaccharide biosynthesis